MGLKFFIVCILLCCMLAMCEASERKLEEARGKKKKIGLLIFIADIILKKIFILKLIYAFVLWLVIHKAGYFITWLIGYLKEQKHDHHEHYAPHHHYDYGPPYDPYRRQSRYDEQYRIREAASQFN